MKRGTAALAIVLFMILAVVAQVSTGTPPGSACVVETSLQGTPSSPPNSAPSDSCYWHEIRCYWRGGELVCIWVRVDGNERHPFDGDPQVEP